MIDDIKEYLKEIPENHKINYLREYMQQIILKIISDSGYKNNITFTGGTALRIIYKINRFSEDLDFSLTKKTGYNFDNLLKQIESSLEKYGLKFEFTKIKKEVINGVFIRFSDLLYPLNLTPQKEQKLSIKIDIDTNPPKGGEFKEFIFNDRFYFLINQFTLESLFALKLHAVLFRKYNKGRDYYDLMFFLNKKIAPKFDLFNNAVKQTDPGEDIKDLNDLFKRVEEKISNMNETGIIEDLQPLILRPDELDLITKKNLKLFLGQYKEAVL